MAVLCIWWNLLGFRCENLITGSLRFLTMNVYLFMICKKWIRWAVSSVSVFRHQDPCCNVKIDTYCICFLFDKMHSSYHCAPSLASPQFGEYYNAIFCSKHCRKILLAKKPWLVSICSTKVAYDLHLAPTAWNGLLAWAKWWSMRANVFLGNFNQCGGYETSSLYHPTKPPLATVVLNWMLQGIVNFLYCFAEKSMRRGS